MVDFKVLPIKFTRRICWIIPGIGFPEDCRISIIARNLPASNSWTRSTLPSHSTADRGIEQSYYCFCCTVRALMGSVVEEILYFTCSCQPTRSNQPQNVPVPRGMLNNRLSLLISGDQDIIDSEGRSLATFVHGKNLYLMQ